MHVEPVDALERDTGGVGKLKLMRSEVGSDQARAVLR